MMAECQMEIMCCAFAVVQPPATSQGSVIGLTAPAFMLSRLAFYM